MSDERTGHPAAPRMPAAADRNITLDVTILGREFKVACRESERAELGEAVTFLDRRMREIRDSGKVSGTDRIAVMAALNIAHELLRARRAAVASRAEIASRTDIAARDGAAIDADGTRRRIQAMQAAIDEMLAGQEKLF